ncbi:hypothetical protein [Aureibacter tunicatorum]|uniref:Uncharacterized protein n=1 Tax=Aureibacter tunicatorum TaxID=866807 RepID=A0AAE3XTQ4_9BACT|nr:hypothetical protein [Aureibacter tunicatorum]MDR6241883.1 hypothetical protein [Aureibacter tunicatorum]BDD07490.1 hypothetical protein AUTU_49730 [Aureibacter tunicatorum]
MLSSFNKKFVDKCLPVFLRTPVRKAFINTALSPVFRMMEKTLKDFEYVKDRLIFKSIASEIRSLIVKHHGDKVQNITIDTRYNIPFRTSYPEDIDNFVEDDLYNYHIYNYKKNIARSFYLFDYSIHTESNNIHKTFIFNSLFKKLISFTVVITLAPDIDNPEAVKSSITNLVELRRIAGKTCKVLFV